MYKISIDMFSQCTCIHTEKTRPIISICTYFQHFVQVSFGMLGSTCFLVQFSGHPHTCSKFAVTMHLMWMKARKCAGERKEAIQNGPDQLRNARRVVAWGESWDKHHILSLDGHWHTHQRGNGATLESGREDKRREREVQYMLYCNSASRESLPVHM